MDDQSVVKAVKISFFESLNSHHLQHSINDIVDILIGVIKTQLCVRHAAFYFYNKQLDSFTPHTNDNEILIEALPNLQYGKCYKVEKDIIFPFIHEDKLHGLLLINEIDDRFHRSTLDEIVQACSSFYINALMINQASQKEQKYKQLYRLTEKFHSFMNRDDVLVELITTLQGMYEHYLFYLFLSHDNENHSELPIKSLEFDEQTGNEKAMEAFVTGKSQLSSNQQSQETVFYTPLKGKQGVYGVLQVVANQGIDLTYENRNFITLLSTAAGNALENAQLYEQSKRLIKDLQLINETSHQLNKNLRLTDNMTYMSSRITDSFDANEVGFFYFQQNGSLQILPGSTGFFETEMVSEYIRYVREKIEKDLEGIFIGDFTTHIENAKFPSVMAVPMVQSDSLKGFALVLHKRPYHFTFDMFKLLQSLIHHSTLALTNSLLREELETLVKTDHLTQLYSRKYMNECIENSMKNDRKGTYILFDIDDFKKINDTYGHQIGDKILVQVAKIIKSNIREKDIGARWGGEELSLYLPQVELEAGVAIAKRIVERVRENTEPMVTLSCGVSYWDAKNLINYNQLFRKADQALYLAKNKGKNQVIVQA